MSRLQNRVSELEASTPPAEPEVRAWIQELDGTVRSRTTGEVMSPEEWVRYKAESTALNILRLVVTPPRRPTVTAPDVTQ
jgi:hypothetical protein